MPSHQKSTNIVRIVSSKPFQLFLDSISSSSSNSLSVLLLLVSSRTRPPQALEAARQAAARAHGVARFGGSRGEVVASLSAGEWAAAEAPHLVQWFPVEQVETFLFSSARSDILLTMDSRRELSLSLSLFLFVSSSLLIFRFKLIKYIPWLTRCL
jgi:hypothetical protein